MISSHKRKNLSWTDLESPTPEEVKEVMQKFAIPPAVADELLRPTVRPKVDAYDKFIYLVLHFPVYDIVRKTSSPCEIDFIVGKNFIITTHYQSIIPLHEMIKTFEVDSLMGEKNMSKSTSRLMFLIIRHLYDFALRQLDHVQEKISIIEEHVFKGLEKEMVKEISFVQRDILEFERSVHAHKSVMASLEAIDGKLMGEEFQRYLRIIEGDLGRVESLLDNSRQAIEILRETNNSLLSNRTNEIMKTLTIMAFITFPVMFLSSLFSMNTNSLPIVGKTGDFWIVVFLMIAAAGATFSVFKKKKWL
ncbi:MAG: magnesium transporter CorA family protein [Candidatus Pacebacteria bacterium]|nr:magnesium transporter CorA family protein [Candidatus Paceibacterota bacterium]